jgi:multidrug efflux pump subunit AcrB
MMRYQQQLGEIVRSDPAVDHVAMFMGGPGNPPNTARMFITLKPRNERSVNADQVIARLRGPLDKVQGARTVPSGGPGRSRRRPRIAHAVPVHAAERGHRTAQRVGAENPDQAEDAARIARCRDRSADGRPNADPAGRS